MMDELSPPAAFVATLGLQPQVITRGLDALLLRDPELQCGTIIHTSSYRSHPNWPTFETFRRYIETQYPDLDWTWVPIAEGTDATVAVEDVNTPESAELAFRHIFNVKKQYKREGYRLHSLIAGGRKSIIVYSMVSAQLLFDVYDRLWHIFSDDEHNRELSLRPHVDPRLTHLAEIPVLHLSGLMPMVRELILHSDDPTRALRLYRDHEDVERNAHLRRFFQQECELIDRQILWLWARAYSNRQISLYINMSESAINRRLNRVSERFFADPLCGRIYGRLTNKGPRVVLLALSPIVNEIQDFPEE